MMAGYAVTRNEWVLKAFDRFKVDVINLSGQDLPFLTARLGQRGEGSADLDPLLGRIVSANAGTDSHSDKSIRSYFVASVPNRESPAGPAIRVAFVGITDDVKQPAAGLRVQNPIETAKRIIPRAKRESDLVIVLTHGSDDVARRIAEEAPGVNAVIAGNGKEFTMPLTVGRVPVVFTPYEGRMLGELRFYRSPDGGYSIKNRFIGLDTTVADDPVALEFVAQSKDAVKKEIERFTKPVEAGSAKANAGFADGARGSDYVSAESCLQCHRGEYMTWANTAHATAVRSLATKAAEMDTGCLACHTTGFNRGGFQMGAAVGLSLANVQCEECHGPGRAHVAKPDKSYGHVGDLQAVCSRCHTAETSAEFKLDTFWAKIKH
jgi:hypothetical protein